MQRQQLVDDIKVLRGLVAEKTTMLADSVMEIDVDEYTDPKQFEREKIELFRHFPQFFGPSCVAPDTGDYFASDDTGIQILIVRQQDGGLKAFVNICSHRGAPLNECAHGRAKTSRLFSCPYHGWTYDLEGKLVGVPFGNERFKGINRDTLDLRPLDVQEKHGMIFVMPDPDNTFDIDEVLGGIQKRLSGFGFEDHYYFQMINDVAVAEDYSLAPCLFGAAGDEAFGNVYSSADQRIMERRP